MSFIQVPGNFLAEIYMALGWNELVPGWSHPSVPSTRMDWYPGKENSTLRVSTGTKRPKNWIKAWVGTRRREEVGPGWNQLGINLSRAGSTCFCEMLFVSGSRGEPRYVKQFATSIPRQTHLGPYVNEPWRFGNLTFLATVLPTDYFF